MALIIHPSGRTERSSLENKNADRMRLIAETYTSYGIYGANDSRADENIVASEFALQYAFHKEVIRGTVVLIWHHDDMTDEPIEMSDASMARFERWVRDVMRCLDEQKREKDERKGCV